MFYIARARAQSENFVRAELNAVQRFEDSLQHQYDGQLRSHVNALQDECREHVGQEEDKMRKELQHALTQESSVCQDQLQQTLRQPVCQEEYAEAASHPEMDPLRQFIRQQVETMKPSESQSQQLVSQQHEEYAHKQHTQFQQFDSVLRDKDEMIQSLRQELANKKERHLQELDQALQDAERRAQQAAQFLLPRLLSRMQRVKRRPLTQWLLLLNLRLGKPFIHQDSHLALQQGT